MTFVRLLCRIKHFPFNICVFKITKLFFFCTVLAKLISKYALLNRYYCVHVYNN